MKYERVDSRQNEDEKRKKADRHCTGATHMVHYNGSDFIYDISHLSRFFPLATI